MKSENLTASELFKRSISRLKSVLFFVTLVLVNYGVSGQIVDYIQSPFFHFANLGAATSMPTPNTIAVGAPGFNGKSGLVYVLDKQNGSWAVRGGSIQPNTQVADSYFGRYVHMPDSNTLVLGAPGYDVNIGSSPEQRSGKVFVFKWNGTSWVQKGNGLSYDNNGTGYYPNFGYRVNMSDSNHLAVSFESSDDNLYNRGGVITYEWNGTSWVQRGSVLQGESVGAFFGRELAMPTSDMLVVAEPFVSFNNYNSNGIIRLYDWNGTDWVPASVYLYGNADNQMLGSSLAVPNDSTIAFWRGNEIAVYSYSALTNWSLKGYAIQNPGSVGTFGQAISMFDSDHIAITNVGESEPSGNGVNSVRVYEFNPTSYQWEVIEGPYWGEQGENFGYSVSLPDLSGVAVGAQLYSSSAAQETGRVHMITFYSVPEGGDSTTTGCYTCDSLQVGDVYRFNGDTLTVVNRAMLDSMVTNGGDFSKVCVSHVTDMSSLFKNKMTFNQDISRWDVSNVTTMVEMFAFNGVFNKNIGSWDVSKVTNMKGLFRSATSFNQDITNWDVSSVSNMSEMFKNNYVFNQNISSWEVSNVLNMDTMFYGASDFDQDLSGWCVGKILSEPTDFATNGSLTSAQKPVWGDCNPNGASFDANGCLICDNYAVGDVFYINGVEHNVVDPSMIDSILNAGGSVANICASKMTNVSGMFRNNPTFNEDIGSWDMSNVTNSEGMFENALSFNQDISNWDMSNVTITRSMFAGAQSFNQDIGDWDVSGVTNMRAMFNGAHSFNQDLSDWDVSNCTNMSFMFANAFSFNQNINSWDVSSVEAMQMMFSQARDFNQPLNNWNTGNVTSMRGMFLLAQSFSQDLSSWCVGNNMNRKPKNFDKASIFGGATLLTPAQSPAWGVPCSGPSID